jgi:hypothetical protein
MKQRTQQNNQAIGCVTIIILVTSIGGGVFISWISNSSIAGWFSAFFYFIIFMAVANLNNTKRK